jgi:hypothetical protein
MRFRSIATAVLSLLIVAGCNGDDDAAPSPPTATASPVATATSTEVPTAAATATPDDPGSAHRELQIGSTDDGSGALDAEFEYDRPVSLFFDTCLGGSGEECTGGVRLYSAVNPGLVALGHSHEDESEDDGHGDEGEEPSLHPLVDGTAVSLEVIAVDEGLSLRIEGTTLDQAGQVVDLGEAPHFHSDSETFLSLNEGEDEHGDFQLSFRLTTGAPAYQPSDPLTVRFGTEESGHAQDDEHEHGD